MNFGIMFEHTNKFQTFLVLCLLIAVRTSFVRFGCLVFTQSSKAFADEKIFE